VARILIADDDPSVLRLLEKWLAGEGHETRSFIAFEAARRELEHWHPDVLVTDVRLVDFNGLQLVLEAKSRNPSVVAIVITGFDDPVLRSECVAAGARFLVKPLKAAEFLEAVKG
jgi:DNA-binding NtrC family response regulator